MRFPAVILFVIVVVLGTFSLVDASRLFRLGRHRNGSVGVSHTPSSVGVSQITNYYRNYNYLSLIAGKTIPAPPSNDSVIESWFDQKLDHFHNDEPDSKTWKQKFQSNSQYYRPDVGRDAVILLMLGGEGPAELKWLTSGAWIELYAPKFNAMAYQLEHRYYGDSHPVENLSMANLQFLSSEQALADAAAFIVNRTQELNLTLHNPDTTHKRARWIVFGGSYSGALAAWLRYKYPHLVFAAVSSSGPVEARLDFAAYMDNVVYAMQTVQNGRGQACLDTVAQAVQQVRALLDNADGRAELQEKFQLCDNTLDAQQAADASNFIESLAGNFQGVVQYNRDNRRGPLYNLTVDDLCDIMTNESDASLLPLDRYAQVNSLLLNRSAEACLDISYARMIANMTDVSWNATDAEGGRQWTYQTCTEFGYYQTSDSQASKIFGNNFPLEFFTQQCMDIFDNTTTFEEQVKAVNWSNTNYGGKNLESSRTVFVNGKIDPWHLLGVSEQTSPNMPVVYMHDTAHCADMYSPAPTDSIFLQNGRRAIMKYLSGWLDLKSKGNF